MALLCTLRRFPADRLFRPWLGVLAVSCLLTLLVELDGLPEEAGVVRDVQAWGVPGEEVSDAVRAVTATSFVVVLGVLIAVAHQAEGDRRAAMVLIVLLVVLVGVQAGLKQLVDRPRPSDAVAGIEVRASQTSPSFPAGHVMGPTVVYGWSLAWLLRGRAPAPQASRGQRTALAIGACLLAGALAAVLALTGIVNVWLGVHWPSDVLGGYLWGLVLLLPALMVSMAGGGTSSPGPLSLLGRGGG